MASALRRQILQENANDEHLVQLYSAVVSRLTNATNLKFEAVALRANYKRGIKFNLCCLRGPLQGGSGGTH